MCVYRFTRPPSLRDEYLPAKPGARTDLSDLLSFSALAALASTVLFALAKVLAKRTMSKEMKAKGFDAVNTYSMLTCCSAALLLVLLSSRLRMVLLLCLVGLLWLRLIR